MKKNRPKPIRLKKNTRIALPSKQKQDDKRIVLPDRMGIQWSIPLQNLRSKSLFVATPMYGGQCTGMFSRCITALALLCKELEIPFQEHYLFNESLIQRGRNYCCDTFLRARHSGPEPRTILDKDGKPVLDEKGNEVKEPDNRPFFTHMLFIDSDISFNPADVICMLAMADSDGPNGDKDVICGPYPKKCISWEKVKHAVDKGVSDKDPNVLERFVGDYVFNPRPIESQTGQIPLNAPIEILEGGTGFMMIQRRVFEKFAAKYPNQLYRPDHVRTKDFDGSRPIYAFFDCPIDRGYTFEDVKALIEKAAKGEEVKDDAQSLLDIEAKASMRYLSEDYMFCQYAYKAGCKIWMLPWIKLQHTGTYIFGGGLVDILLIGSSATADPTKLGGKK